jgi:MATE family, multidrug efflux pump
VAAVPSIGAAAGGARPVLVRLSWLPAILALAVLVQAVGAWASSTLVTIGHSRIILRAGLLATGAAVVLSAMLVRAAGVPEGGLAILGSAAACTGQVQRALRT